MTYKIKEIYDPKVLDMFAEDKLNWLDKYNEIMADEYRDNFGHNTEFDFLPQFKKIEKLGGEITIVDGDTIKIHLPKKAEELLLFIINNLPGATNAKFNKKKQELTLEWHY
jgi:hypothetical protein